MTKESCILSQGMELVHTHLSGNKSLARNILMTCIPPHEFVIYILNRIMINDINIYNEVVRDVLVVIKVWNYLWLYDYDTDKK